LEAPFSALEMIENAVDYAISGGCFFAKAVSYASAKA